MSTEMCDFVKLVLDRMDTNPEEFIDGDPKHRWGDMAAAGTKGIFTDAHLACLCSGRDLCRQRDG